jgi:glycosyltransferase involved in cell wall biosynthesis
MASHIAFPVASATACPQPRIRPVVLVALAKRFGGAEVRILAIARALHGTRRYMVAVCAGSRLHHFLEAEGLNAFPLPYGRTDPRNFYALYRLIRREGFEVVDAHNPQSQIWGLWAARRARVPVKVWTVHSDYRTAGGSGGWKPRALRTFIALGKRWDCRFIAVSQPIVDHLRASGVAGTRIILSPNASTVPRVEGPAGLRAALGWQTNPVVTVVARLDPVKGHRVLLMALAALAADKPQLRCLVVGDGPERKSLRAAVAHLGLGARVHFTGFRADVPAILRESDLFCLPSLTEGLPFAVLEAAQLGLPLLLTRVGELPAYFRHGETARLVKPGDAHALARELRWLLEQRAEAAALARNAQRMVQARFAPERMIAETLHVYDHA